MAGDGFWHSVPAAGSGGVAPVLHVRDEKTAGTNGGTFTSGSWQLRTLNTVKANQITGASLSASQVTLPAGTFWIDAAAAAFRVNGHQLRLYNATDGAVLVEGLTSFEASAANSQGEALLRGSFTLAASKAVELQHRCATTRAADGFGGFQSLGSVEIYADVAIWQLS